eukprot:CAMPEP_0181124122 /NCGR_PEP_ID=MMETSP1071-20121207/26295_1 /TAXON_ID=35127 /ORGANISM="Thalassiosira sp., Strain NH16" /LENGTH=415 /DNA_ID=CAMNT_0023209371 /DNA_START=141 /DNA_END=1388 /DNA_ORIENTATION=-
MTDGSGKSIKMEAPLAKAIRSADGFIKGTYVWFFVSILFIWGGWSWMRRNSASMILDCNSSGCTLTIQRPYYFLPRNSSSVIPVKSKSERTTKIEIKRDQLVRADNIKWDPESRQISENYGLNSPTYTSQQKILDADAEDGEGNTNKPWNQHKKKKKKKQYKKSGHYRHGGPDADGNYDSYVIVLRDPLPPSFESDEEIDPNESPSKKMQRQMAAQHNSMANDPNSLASMLAPYAITEDVSNRVSTSSTEYIIHLRDFNLGQTRRLARTNVSKINAYTKGRRASCILRESRPVAWQGLVLLILGIFSVVLCLLLGQFWEEHDPTKVGSYRKRMAEIRKREEATKNRRRRNVGRKPPVRRPEATRSTGKVGGSAPRTQATGSARMRPTAGANRAHGGDSWVGSVGGAAHEYKRRGF